MMILPSLALRHHTAKPSHPAQSEGMHDQGRKEVRGLVLGAGLVHGGSLAPDKALEPPADQG